ncbi:YtpI family protein [Solibacillus sp. CAU 1738]|uniref:YtpI family protein n=1 Tax=Solibacillus sp. CAU 1738 TaxID=3140363 RepID=UPI0032603726
MLNYIFVFFIVVSFVFYFYYKTKQFRSTLPIRKKWYTAKAGVALGVFIIAFGLNATIIYPTAVGYGVAVVFIILGASLAFNNYKRARHEGQYIQEEYELNK